MVFGFDGSITTSAQPAFHLHTKSFPGFACIGWFVQATDFCYRSIMGQEQQHKWYCCWWGLLRCVQYVRTVETDLRPVIACISAFIQAITYRNRIPHVTFAGACINDLWVLVNRPIAPMLWQYLSKIGLNDALRWYFSNAAASRSNINNAGFAVNALYGWYPATHGAGPMLGLHHAKCVEFIWAFEVK